MDFSNYLNTKAAELSSSSIPPKKVGKRKKNSFRMRVKPSERGKLVDLKIQKKKLRRSDPRRTLQGPFAQVLSPEFAQALKERPQKSTTARNATGLTFLHDGPLHE